MVRQWCIAKARYPIGAVQIMVSKRGSAEHFIKKAVQSTAQKGEQGKHSPRGAVQCTVSDFRAHHRGAVHSIVPQMGQ